MTLFASRGGSWSNSKAFRSPWTRTIRSQNTPLWGIATAFIEPLDSFGVVVKTVRPGRCHHKRVLGSSRSQLLPWMQSIRHVARRGGSDLLHEPRCRGYHEVAVVGNHIVEAALRLVATVA